MVLYGAGDVGKDYYTQFITTKYYQIVAWVDMNYKNIRNDMYDIQSPQIINKLEFDYVIIALSRLNIIMEVTDKLSSIVDQEKIIFMQYEKV